MQYLLLVYTDDMLLDGLADGEFDRMMRGCLQHADALRADGTLLDFQQLEPASTAKSVRTRDGRTQVLDGPFSETKEMLAGFNLIEADSEEEALRIAQALPWTRTGCIEVRPVRDVGAVRARVGA
ncbi:YciI family protein [Luteimonas sp. BDR2-5]|uniref:YciI family protein n=1 Tax=Proluteimonas luteida TaxID=2878685 RepID=UPI001E2EF5DC|nr:YciI family protein [Luteimonas sp. BDR2-5]MCD9029827.1 YciI family protein [Luteimonas sp. BDR2-5]